MTPIEDCGWEQDSTCGGHKSTGLEVHDFLDIYSPVTTVHL